MPAERFTQSAAVQHRLISLSKKKNSEAPQKHVGDASRLPVTQVTIRKGGISECSAESMTRAFLIRRANHFDRAMRVNRDTFRNAS
jgi:hypothetical protein